MCKDNSYLFDYILIRRLKKPSKKHPENVYLCAVWLKECKEPESWYITEERLVEITEELEGRF